MRVIILFLIFPIFIYAQLNYFYESKKDGFEVRFPEKPEIKELKWMGKDENGKDTEMFARNYKAGELLDNGFAMYDVTYTSKHDGTPIKFTEKQIPDAMEGYLKGLMLHLHDSQKIYSKNFMYDNKYPALEYKIKCTAVDMPMFKKGFFVLKNGKFINIAIMYNRFYEKMYKKRYKVFTESFKF
jgi:hypothetical protein